MSLEINLYIFVVNVLGDLDQDGVVEENELEEMKMKLRNLFDHDKSGKVEKDEIAQWTTNEETSLDESEIQCIISSLDSNQDRIISSSEIDSRYESLGAELTTEEVMDWVSYGNLLPQYKDMVQKYGISGYSFPLLMEKNGQRLLEMGVEVELHREQLVRAMRNRYAGLGKCKN